MSNFDMSYLGVMVDMAGCPNCCRHCWLGSHRNGNISVDEFKSIAAQFRNWHDEEGRGIAEMSFFSWWREPDYRNDYPELWLLEQELSSPAKAKRFELLSTWRLARDCDLNSKKLYDKIHLITRIMHQWGMEYMKGGK